MVHKSLRKVIAIALSAAVLLSLTAPAQAVIIQGEVTPGTYVAVKVDANGNFITGALVPATGVLIDRSGTFTSANVAQVIMPARAGRKYLLIQNSGDTIFWCNFTNTATASQPSYMFAIGASFVMESVTVSSEAISCISSVAGKGFTAKEM